MGPCTLLVESGYLGKGLVLCFLREVVIDTMKEPTTSSTLLQRNKAPKRQLNFLYNPSLLEQLLLVVVVVSSHT